MSALRAEQQALERNAAAAGLLSGGAHVDKEAAAAAAASEVALAKANAKIEMMKQAEVTRRALEQAAAAEAALAAERKAREDAANAAAVAVTREVEQTARRAQQEAEGIRSAALAEAKKLQMDAAAVAEQIKATARAAAVRADEDAAARRAALDARASAAVAATAAATAKVAADQEAASRAKAAAAAHVKSAVEARVQAEATEAAAAAAMQAAEASEAAATKEAGATAPTEMVKREQGMEDAQSQHAAAELARMEQQQQHGAVAAAAAAAAAAEMEAIAEKRRRDDAARDATSALSAVEADSEAARRLAAAERPSTPVAAVLLVGSDNSSLSREFTDVQEACAAINCSVQELHEAFRNGSEVRCGPGNDWFRILNIDQRHGGDDGDGNRKAPQRTPKPLASASTESTTPTMAPPSTPQINGGRGERVPDNEATSTPRKVSPAANISEGGGKHLGNLSFGSVASASSADECDGDEDAHGNSRQTRESWLLSSSDGIAQLKSEGMQNQQGASQKKAERRRRETIVSAEEFRASVKSEDGALPPWLKDAAAGCATARSSLPRPPLVPPDECTGHAVGNGTGAGVENDLSFSSNTLGSDSEDDQQGASSSNLGEDVEMGSTPMNNMLELPAKLRALEEREAVYGQAGGGGGGGGYWDTGEDYGEEDSSAADGTSEEEEESSFDEDGASDTGDGSNSGGSREDVRRIGEAALRQQMATATPTRRTDPTARHEASPALSTDMQGIADRLFNSGGGGGGGGGGDGGSGSGTGNAYRSTTASRFNSVAGMPANGVGGASPARENMYAIMRAVGSDSDSMDDDGCGDGGSGGGYNYGSGGGGVANDSFDSDFSD